MKSCNVYFDSDSVYVIASAETTHGFNVATEPMIKLPRTTPPTMVGVAVLRALNAYRKGVPVPKNLAGVDRALLEFVGYKSWVSFERQAKCVLVELEKQAVRVFPTKSGSEGGFLFVPEHAELTDPAPEKIANAIDRALERCGT